MTAFLQIVTEALQQEVPFAEVDAMREQIKRHRLYKRAQKMIEHKPPMISDNRAKTFIVGAITQTMEHQRRQEPGRA